MPTISYKRPDGKEVRGYYAEPAGSSGAPGIVVIQEWWGLNEQIKGAANRFSGAGYRVLVPDLYRGKVTVEAREAQHMMEGLNFGDAAAQDVRGAVQYLKADSEKVGVTGFCMGGALTFLAAANVPEADAAASWYGYPPLQYLDAGKIKMPVLAHFALNDAHFPYSTVAELETKLKAAGVKFEFHSYDANHAFANETGPAYKRDPAELAWQRTLQFFGKTLLSS